MRSLVLIILAVVAPAAAAAQSVPPPIDYTKPFVYDPAEIPRITTPDHPLPIEILPPPGAAKVWHAPDALNRQEIPEVFRPELRSREIPLHVEPVQSAPEAKPSH
jgi:hypothetical protein